LFHCDDGKSTGQLRIYLTEYQEMVDCVYFSCNNGGHSVKFLSQV